MKLKPMRELAKFKNASGMNPCLMYETLVSLDLNLESIVSRFCATPILRHIVNPRAS
jgi:hypothetical protein